MRSSLCLAVALAVGSVTAITAFDAPAQTTKAVRATAEASMVLTGTIDVATDGSVSNLVLDQRERLTPTIAGFVDGTIRSWRFEPTVQDGRAVSVTAPIRVRLLGKPAADGTMEVRMTGVNFNVYSDKDTDTVTRREMGPPSYPQQAFRNGVQGEVVLLIRVDRDGNAADVATEQVNLGVVGPERSMRQMRDLFANASTAAARKWTFAPPTTGKDKDAAEWTVRTVVSYTMSDGPGVQPTPYGVWKPFIPGPRQSAPWRQQDVAQEGSDLLPAGGVYMVDGAHRGLRLLTALAED
ncbi:energy transducer TonB [Stenotrophomonas cyclobalanopsidis]|uniref:Energy transducer TonB n=1 Tax=Stenotrophomonas cyclobalanopsidis TaxID=2771362 RepID=A0ABQ6T5P4_9GAMM|nr:energy transducer TonB [Stenotrophomonas cyclobalanopsidis]KAA9004281.1 energy transducer TonB [Stenotrophomonas cyclobalanopsidis]